jgi:hypothetical protein
MTQITGNLNSIHVIVGREDLIIFSVSAGKYGGLFNTTVDKVKLDGKDAVNVADVISFVQFRSFIAIRLHGVSADGSLGQREIELAELLQVESPIKPSTIE